MSSLLCALPRAHASPLQQLAAATIARIEHELDGAAGGVEGAGEGNDEGASASAATAAAGSLKPAPQQLYLYKNADGRMVYTNIVEQVPTAEREAAKLDLSHITLNTELGNEMRRQLEHQHEELTDSPYCEQMREAAEVGLLERIWQDFAPLVVCGGALLGFLLFTPSALRRFGAPAWTKVLTMAIPSLALAGLVTFSMMQTNKTLVALKRAAAPCEKGALAKLSQSNGPILQHVQLVHQLRKLALSHPGAADLDSIEAQNRELMRVLQR